MIQASLTPAEPRRGRRARPVRAAERPLPLLRLRFWNSGPHCSRRPRGAPSTGEAGTRGLPAPGGGRGARATSIPPSTLPPLRGRGGAGRRAGGGRGRVTRDRARDAQGRGSTHTARSGGGRRPGCSARGPFSPESGPGSREPVSRTDLGDLCFVISCRPVGFRKRRGTRSFPPRPPSLRPPPPPLTVFERERRCDGPVPPPRVSGAGLPSPPPWRVTAGPAPGPDPRPRAALCGSPAARAAPCGSPPPRDLAPAGGRAGGGRAVHVDLAAVCYPRREGAVPGRYPGVPCLFPPLFGAPRV